MSQRVLSNARQKAGETVSRPARLRRALFAAFFLALVSGCDPIEPWPPNGGEPTAPDNGVKEAQLDIVNNKEQDPGTLTFHLYSEAAQSIQDAPHVKVIGSVGFGRSASFKVPAGRFKIGYADEAGDLFPMPNYQDDVVHQGSWYKVEFEPGAVYTLQLVTDGNRTMWITNMVAIP